MSKFNIYNTEILVQEIKSFPSQVLFDLARNDHASRIARMLAANELMIRGDQRAHHIEVYPFAIAAVNELIQALEDAKAAEEHVPTSPEPELEPEEIVVEHKPLTASVTVQSLLQDEVVLNKPSFEFNE